MVGCFQYFASLLEHFERWTCLSSMWELIFMVTQCLFLLTAAERTVIVLIVRINLFSQPVCIRLTWVNNGVDYCWRHLIVWVVSFANLFILFIEKKFPFRLIHYIRKLYFAFFIGFLQDYLTVWPVIKFLSGRTTAIYPLTIIAFSNQCSIWLR